jgi:hypothetical protein
LLLYQPKFFDILPQYVLLMAAAPWILKRVATGHTRQVVLLSAGLCLLAQSGLDTMSLATLVGSLRAHGLDLPVGLDFNPLAWQLIVRTRRVTRPGPGLGTWRARCMEDAPSLRRRAEDGKKVGLPAGTGSRAR